MARLPATTTLRESRTRTLEVQSDRKVRGVVVLETNPPVAIVVHPKTGSRTIVAALKATGLTRHTGGRHRVEPEVVEEVKARGGFVVASVRNPYDTIVSWYYHRLNAPDENRTWEQWLPAFVTDGLEPWIAPGGRLFPEVVWADRIIRFETMQEDLQQIFDELHLELIPLPHIGRCEIRKPWPEYYDREKFDLVNNRFPEDFSELGYARE